MHRYRQKIDFSSFPGPVVATTNCVLDPPKSYKNRLFTTNEVRTWLACDALYCASRVPAGTPLHHRRLAVAQLVCMPCM